MAGDYSDFKPLPLASNSAAPDDYSKFKPSSTQEIPQKRDVGVGESAFRGLKGGVADTIGSLAAIPGAGLNYASDLARSAGAPSLANALGTVGDAAFGLTKRSEDYAKSQQINPETERQGIPAQIASGIASVPSMLSGHVGRELGNAENVDTATAEKQNAFDTGLNAAVSAVPLGLGAKIAERAGGGLGKQVLAGAASGAGINAALGPATRYAENALLGTDNPVETPETLGVDLGTGVAFGAHGGHANYHEVPHDALIQTVNDDGSKKYLAPNGDEFESHKDFAKAWRSADENQRRDFLSPKVPEESTPAGALGKPSLVPEVDPVAAAEQQRVADAADQNASKLYADREAEEQRRASAQAASEPTKIAGELPAPTMAPFVDPQVEADQLRSASAADDNAQKLYADRAEEEQRRQLAVDSTGLEVGQQPQSDITLASKPGTKPPEEPAVSADGIEVGHPPVLDKTLQTPAQKKAADLQSAAQAPDAGPLTKAVGNNIEHTSLGQEIENGSVNVPAAVAGDGSGVQGDHGNGGPLAGDRNAAPELPVGQRADHGELAPAPLAGARENQPAERSAAESTQALSPIEGKTYPSIPAANKARNDAGQRNTHEALKGPDGSITLQPKWQAFPPESGTLGVPRDQMPQVKAEHRGALVNFLNARGVAHEQQEVDPRTLKATQAEYSPAKVEQAKNYEGGDRSILISSDNHIVDGHHQAVAAAEKGLPVKAIRLDAPIHDLLPLVKEFPSAEAAAGAKPDATSEPAQGQQQAALPPRRITPADDARLKDGTYHEKLRQMADEAGWSTVGGRILRGADGEVNGRTTWTPHAPWYSAFARSGVKLPGSDYAVRQAVKKALDGKPMTAAEKRAVSWMLDHVDGQRAEDAAYEKEHAIDPYDPTVANNLDLVGLDPSNENNMQLAALSAQAHDIDAEAEERAAIQHADDDVSYRKALEEIIYGSEGQQDTGAESARSGSSDLEGSQAESARQAEPESAGAKPEAEPAAAKSEVAPKDLLGTAPVKEQALADAQRAKDAQRNGTKDVPADIDGGLFSDRQKQTDIEDAAKGGDTPFKRDASTAGLGRDAIKPLIDSIVSKWEGGPKVHVVNSMDEAPASVRAEYEKQQAGGAKGAPRGFISNGEVYIVGNAIKTPKQAIQTLFHEALGHYGLRDTYGKELGGILRQIAGVRKAEVEAKMAEYGFTDTPLNRMRAAEEVLANMAETRPELGFVRNAIAAIRTFLRNAGVDLHYSDDEIIRNFILPARRAVEGDNGKSMSGFSKVLEPQAAFSRATREEGYPKEAGDPVSTFSRVEDLKKHPDYKAAKSGDREAAARLVSDLVKPEQIMEAQKQFGDNAIYVPAHGLEATGHNQIPNALARYYAEKVGGSVATDIVQANQPHHTGADQMERLKSRPLFDGPIEAGKKYVVVDDVSTMGATLAELADHIRAGGGQVEGSVLLANASRSGKLSSPKTFTNLVDRRFGDEVRKQFNVEPGALTHDEAKYLAGFKDAEQLRTRAATADRERERRLLSKGVLTKPEEVSSGKDDGTAFRLSDDRSDSAFKSLRGRAESAKALLSSDISPETKVQQLGRGVLRDAAARQDQAITTADRAVSDYQKHFDSLQKMVGKDPAKLYADIIAYQKGEKVLDPVAKTFIDTATKLLDKQVASMNAINPEALQGLRKNYFVQSWADEDASAAQKLVGNKSFTGPKSFTKERVFDNYEEGMANGLTPRFANPVDAFMSRYTQGERYLAALRIQRDLAKAGFEQQAATDHDVPAGYSVPLDKAFRKIIPILVKDKVTGEQKGAAAQQLIAYPDQITRDINNLLDPGLNKFAAWRTFRGVQNFMLSARLGFSAFHAGFTSMDVLITHVDRSMRQLLSGDIAGATKTLASSSPFSSYQTGKTLMEQFLGVKQADAQTQAVFEALLQGGARAYMDPTDTNNSLAQYTRAIRQGDKASLANPLKAILALMESSSHWIAHKLVPYQKMVARVILAKQELEKLGEMLGTGNDYQATLAKANPDVLKQIMGKVVDSVDDRLGQFAYDNTFWNKTLKNMMQAMVQSVGWNFGTARVIGGGIADTKRLFAPEKTIGSVDAAGQLGVQNLSRVTNRLSYLISMNATVGLMGAALQYMMTGEGPDDVQDMFFPRTGRLNADGSKERLSLPSYVKDEFAFARHPGDTIQHKMHPFFSEVAELWNNQDFYGTQIINPDHDMVHQAQDLATYIGKGFAPYAATSAIKSAQTGQSLPLTVAPFFGVSPAPASITRTAFQDFVADRTFKSSTSRTQEQADATKAKHDAEDAIRKGDKPDLTVFTPRDRMQIIRAAQKQVPEIRFDALSFVDKLKAWDKATDEERQAYNLRRDIVRAAPRALASAPEDVRTTLLDKVREIRTAA